MEAERLSWIGVWIAQAVYLFLPFLPSAVLSAVVLRFDLWKGLKRPIDGGLQFRGRRVFGDHKTWRGFAWSAIGCVVTVAAQKHWIGAAAGPIAVIDYANANALGLGLAMGCGAILGELPNSFVKRQLRIPPGEAAPGAWRTLFYLWDQLDLLLVTWPILSFWVQPRWELVAVSCILVLVLHQAFSQVGHAVGARSPTRP